MNRSKRIPKPICKRCRERMFLDRMYDVPDMYYEFFCINCGERIWVEKEKILIEFFSVT